MSPNKIYFAGHLCVGEFKLNLKGNVEDLQLYEAILHFAYLTFIIIQRLQRKKLESGNKLQRKCTAIFQFNVFI